MSTNKTVWKTVQRFAIRKREREREREKEREKHDMEGYMTWHESGSLR